MATRYVNLASTAGGDGTTDNTSGSTRAFASLQEAANSLPSSPTEPYTIYVRGPGRDTLPVNQTPFDQTTSTPNFIEIVAQEDDYFRGKWRADRYILAITNSSGLYNNLPAHWRVRGVQIEMTVDDGGSYVGLKSANANVTAADADFRVSDVCVRGIVINGSIIGFESRPLGAGGAGTSRFWNCVAWNCTTGFSSDFVSTELYNCTAYGGDYGYVSNATNGIKAVNCAAVNQAQNDFVAGGSFTSTSNYNASTLSGAPGANSRNSQTITLLDPASGDLRLSMSDGGARDFGTADPASGLYSTDVSGHTRSGSWDIGASEAHNEPLDAEGYRWYDDGTESGSVASAAQDTNISAAADTIKHLRFGAARRTNSGT